MEGSAYVVIFGALLAFLALIASGAWIGGQLGGVIAGIGALLTACWLIVAGWIWATG